MRQPVTLVFLVLVTLLSTRCNMLPSQTVIPETEAATVPMTAETPEATTAPSSTPGATPTTPAPTATAAETATPTPTALPLTEAYGFQVSYTLDMEPDDPAAGPPEGERWIVVVTAIQNNSGEPLVIERQSLILIDQQGGRYVPDEPDEETSPPLVGARLEAGEDLLGLVRFTIPDDARPVTLEWCPQGPTPCSQPLVAPVP